MSYLARTGYSETLINKTIADLMGLSRDTFYRYQNAVEQGGIEALIDRSRRKPNLKNRVDEQTEAAVVAYAIEQPAHGQVRASNELRKRGVLISPSGVRCVWLTRLKILNRGELSFSNTGKSVLKV